MSVAGSVNLTVNGVISTSVQALASQLAPLIRQELAREVNRGSSSYNVNGA